MVGFLGPSLLIKSSIYGIIAIYTGDIPLCISYTILSPWLNHIESILVGWWSQKNFSAQGKSLEVPTVPRPRASNLWWQSGKLQHFVLGVTNKSDQHADFSLDSEGVLTSSIRRVACLVAGAAAGCYCKMPLQGACVRVRFVLWSCQGSAVRVLLSECCVSECRTR